MAQFEPEMKKFKRTENWTFVGKGGYGTVYKDVWMDPKTNKSVMAAFKQTKQPEEDPEMTITFDKEMNAFKLNHLFVVKYLDLVQIENKNYTSDYPVIVMELCEGSLKHYVLKGLPTIPKDSLNDRVLLGQVVLGLAYIHSQGIIHKDLKPDNILLWCSPTGLVLAKLADFGFSKGLKKDETEHSGTTHDGTPGYMAPELLAREICYEKVSASYASDAYALGIVISFTANKGQHPYGFNKTVRDYLMLLGTAPPNLEGDWDLIDIVARLTNREPKKRPQVDIVIYHPYFVLSNEKTKMSYIDKLYNFFESFASWTYETDTVDAEGVGDGDDDADDDSPAFTTAWFQKYFKHSLEETDASSSSRKGSVTSASSPIDISDGGRSIDYSSPISTTSNSPRDPLSAKLAEASSKPSSFDRKIEQYLSNHAETDTIQQIKKTNNFTRSHIYSLILRNPKLINFYIWCLMYELTIDYHDKSSRRFPRVLRILAITNNHFNKCLEMTEFEFANSFYDDPEIVKEIWNLKYGLNESSVDPQPIFAYTASSHFPPFMWDTLIQRFNQHLRSTENGIKQRPLLNWVSSNESSNISQEPFIISILANGGDPNGVDIFGQTPVHIAARNISPFAPAILRVLLNRKGDPNKPNKRTQDPVLEILSKTIQAFFGVSHSDVKNKFLQKFVYSNSDTTEDDQKQSISSNPLWKLYFDDEWRPTKTFRDLMEQLKVPILLHPMVLEALASFLMAKLIKRNLGPPDIKNWEKRTPLHCAASNESPHAPKLVKILLEFKGDPNYQDDRGSTPLHCAAANSSDSALEITEILLKHGGDPTILDGAGKKAIDVATVNKGKCGSRIRALLMEGHVSNLS